MLLEWSDVATENLLKVSVRDRLLYKAMFSSPVRINGSWNSVSDASLQSNSHLSSSKANCSLPSQLRASTDTPGRVHRLEKRRPSLHISCTMRFSLFGMRSRSKGGVLKPGLTMQLTPKKSSFPLKDSYQVSQGGHRTSL